jgi:hypothetical protein
LRNGDNFLADVFRQVFQVCEGLMVDFTVMNRIKEPITNSYFVARMMKLQFVLPYMGSVSGILSQFVLVIMRSPWHLRDFQAVCLSLEPILSNSSSVTIQHLQFC